MVAMVVICSIAIIVSFLSLFVPNLRAQNKVVFYVRHPTAEARIVSKEASVNFKNAIISL